MTDYLAKAAEHLATAANAASRLLNVEKRAQIELDIAREYAKLAAIERGLLPAPTGDTDLRY